MPASVKQWALPLSGAAYLRALLETHYHVEVVASEQLAPDMPTSDKARRDGARLRHVMTISNPYYWIVARSKTARVPALDVISGQKLRVLMAKWRDTVLAYERFVEENPRNSCIARLEDFVAGAEGLSPLAKALRLRRKKEGGAALAEPPVNPKFIERELYLNDITPRVLRVVNQVVPAGLITRQGYERRLAPRLKLQRQRAQRPTEWWDLNITPENYPRFMTQTGWEEDPQRCRFRDFLKREQVRSMIDCGGGPGVELNGIRQEGLEVEYTLLEVTQQFISTVAAMGARTLQGSVENIPAEDDSFDLAYTRQVLEHVGDWRRALREMVRVARHYVYIAMNKPLGKKTTTRRDHKTGLWLNVYSAADFKAELESIPKVRRITATTTDVEVWLEDQTGLHT